MAGGLCVWSPCLRWHQVRSWALVSTFRPLAQIGRGPGHGWHVCALRLACLGHLLARCGDFVSRKSTSAAFTRRAIRPGQHRCDVLAGVRIAGRRGLPAPRLFRRGNRPWGSGRWHRPDHPPGRSNRTRAMQTVAGTTSQCVGCSRDVGPGCPPWSGRSPDRLHRDVHGGCCRLCSWQADRVDYRRALAGVRACCARQRWPVAATRYRRDPQVPRLSRQSCRSCLPKVRREHGRSHQQEDPTGILGVRDLPALPRHLAWLGRRRNRTSQTQGKKQHHQGNR